MSASVAQQEIGWGQPGPRRASLDMRWSIWLSDNHGTFLELVAIARELKGYGEARISMDMVFHVARYRHIRDRKPGERWTLNNSFTSRAARAMEGAFPDLAGCFETRLLAGERDGNA